MRFAALASGSEGNALLVQHGSTLLMMDCGLPLREVKRGLHRLGLEPAQLSAILVTHEHGDHIGGVPALASAFNLPVFASHGTLSSAQAPFTRLPRLMPFDSHDPTPLVIGDLEICPIRVPHDTREPVQYRFDNGQHRLGVLTDLGSLTPHVVHCLTGVDALVLECNYEPDLLARGRYPARLQQRIRGPLGHLANQQAAELLTQLDCSRLQHLLAAHLSNENNRPELAQQALATALGCTPDWIGVARQRTGFDWRELH
ncbi:MBL fold metallo-hydrolase [Leeia sp.]|uniref:MBL fold metallo-hydrolase n=1 Tax=Leeia sp. TaxID=2884678 RepID=UPI0035B3570F